MKKILLSMICFLQAVVAMAQSAISTSVALREKPDSIDLGYYGRKKPWQAAATVVGLNLGIWAFDRYIQKGDFAYISFNSIKENFKHGFIWDNDQLGTNFLLHPYHGNLYFNAARANGMNYWQSGLYAIGGSAMWEMFMECEYPSTNDIIATPIGGMAIGEVLYRTSDIILKDNTTGWERFGREAAAFVVSPMRGLTRIINGDAWRKRAATGRQFGIPNVSIGISAGMRMLEFRDDIFDTGFGFATEINIEYGDRFETKSVQPYDYFRFRATLNLHSSQPVLGQLNIVGRLIGREVLDSKTRHLSVGIYQHFDYYDSDTISDVSAKIPYKFSAPASVGCGVLYRQSLLKNWQLDAYLHANGLILAGVLSDYYEVDDRNYNVASGFGTKAGVNVVFNDDKFSIGVSHEFYRAFTWRSYPRDMNWSYYNPRTLNAQGDHSQASFLVFEARADFRLWRRLYLTGSFAAYVRNTDYRDYENVHSTTSETRLMLTYKL